MSRHLCSGPLGEHKTWGLTESQKAKSRISVRLKEGRGETTAHSSSERPGTISEIKRGLSRSGKRNEERQRCEVRGERSRRETIIEINMTQPGPRRGEKVRRRGRKSAEERGKRKWDTKREREIYSVRLIQWTVWEGQESRREKTHEEREEVCPHSSVRVKTTCIPEVFISQGLRGKLRFSWVFDKWPTVNTPQIHWINTRTWKQNDFY